MFDISLLTDQSILICPNNVKVYLLKYFSEHNPAFRIKYLSKKDLFNGVNYTYDHDALVYLHDKYGLSYANAEEALDNLLDKEFITEKTKLLHTYYQELNENGLLKFNSLFKNLFINKKVFVYGYSKDDVELINTLKKVTSDYQFLDNVGETYPHTYLSFKTIEEEVLYVFNDLMEKIKSGVNLNRLHFMKYAADYDFLIKKYVHYLKLPFQFEDSNLLSDSPLFKRYLELIKDNDHVKAYEMLKEDSKNDPYDALGKLANVVNSISFLKLDDAKFIELLCYLASTTELKKVKFDHAITVINENDIIGDDDFVYVLGFSLGSYPRIYRDVDFYSDKEKMMIGLNTSKNKSAIAEEEIINFVNHTKNLIISHKTKIGKTVFYPSLIIEKLGMIEELPKEFKERFNTPMAEMESAIAKDNKRIYGVNNDALVTYSDEDIRYMQFDHTFKGVPSFDHEQDLKLAYTSINEYYTCPFQFYLKMVLKANIFEDRFTTELGNLFHKMLQDSIAKDVQVSDYEGYIDEHFKTAKDIFFLNMLIPQVFDVIKKNREHAGNSKYKSIKAEKYILVDIDEHTQLEGHIDKVMFDQEDKSLAVVDYKTYGFYFDAKKLPFGMDLQLPIYSYLLSKEYPDYYNTGMYIQNVCLSKKDLLKEDAKPYYLNGLTADNQFKVQRLDLSLGKLKDEKGKIIPKSKYVTGLSISGKGEISGAKGSLMDEEDYAKLKDIAINKVVTAVREIRNGHFPIRPLRFVQDKNLEFITGKTNCTMCGCRSICFMKDSDINLVDLKA